MCAYPEKFAPLLEEGKVQLNQRAVPLAKEPITAENAGRRLWTRVERQAVFRLPKSGAILFSVHTFVKPLHGIEAHPEEVSFSITSSWMFVRLLLFASGISRV